MSVTIYGIKNCDTIKKARASLAGECVVAELQENPHVCCRSRNHLSC
jgi:arsenate reductase-like glutaredoxin family protein